MRIEFLHPSSILTPSPWEFVYFRWLFCHLHDAVEIPCLRSLDFPDRTHSGVFAPQLDLSHLAHSWLLRPCGRPVLPDFCERQCRAGYLHLKNAIESVVASETQHQSDFSPVAHLGLQRRGAMSLLLQYVPPHRVDPEDQTGVRSTQGVGICLIFDSNGDQLAPVAPCRSLHGPVRTLPNEYLSPRTHCQIRIVVSLHCLFAFAYLSDMFLLRLDLLPLLLWCCSTSVVNSV